jgi:succinoglycan biosynthesis protein ExoL
MTRILYLSHDLDDPATWRRVSMLETGGAWVEVAGLRRGTSPLDRKATVLGQTHAGRFLHRGLSTLRLAFGSGDLSVIEAPDAILARNLEMLPLALKLRKRFSRRRRPRLIYEVLDIHRLLVGSGAVPSLLRFVERRLCRSVDCVLVSSLRFETEHFRRHGQFSAPALLVENKVWDPEAINDVPQLGRPSRPAGAPIVIGWFGILRCAKSLECLDRVCREAEGRVRLVLRGRPALDVLTGFHRIVDSNPYIEFHGAYRYPSDLPKIYSSIDLAWLVDRFDAGANSDWLLPNRLYESCAHGAVPLGLAGTETGDYLGRRGLGLVLPELRPEAVATLLGELDGAGLAAMRARIAALDASEWRTTRQDCIRLVDQLVGQGMTGRDAATLPDHRRAEIA